MLLVVQQWAMHHQQAQSSLSSITKLQSCLLVPREKAIHYRKAPTTDTAANSSRHLNVSWSLLSLPALCAPVCVVL